MPRTRFLSVALLLVVVAARVGDAQPVTATAPAGQKRPLRVATGPVAPFVLEENGALTGFSVELWQEISRQLELEFTWVELGNRSEQLQAVARGDADVAISAITMTPEREAMVDFSTSYFDSGLQIMVPMQASTPFLSMAEALVSPGIRQLALVALGVAFLLANVLWLVERRTNPSFQKGYLRGILEGWWGVVLIVATGEHGDRETPSVVKRLTVTAMWLLGIVFIAQLTAAVASSLTIKHLHSRIEGPGDLPGKSVGTIPETLAAEYLRQLGIPFTELRSIHEGIDILKQGELQAIVFKAPTLQYWARKRGRGLVEVVGPLFRPEKYGIAVALGNPLRKQINEALITLYDNGKYEALHKKWFATSR